MSKELLRCEDNPHPELNYRADLTASHFTFLDPDGRPVFAALEISYWPDERCVVLSSVRDYLASYRQRKLSAEDAVGRVTNDLAEALDPDHLRVEALFHARDGAEQRIVAQWPADDEDDPEAGDRPEWENN